jgi:hypothetical protein
MVKDNLIELASFRAKATGGDLAARVGEASKILKKLHDTPRISKSDRRTIVGNLGRLATELDPENTMEVTLSILQPNYRAKRKSYIRFQDESFKRPTRFAASGPAFVGIIQRLIDLRCAKGSERPQTTIETIHRALKGTSFRRSSNFQMLAEQTKGITARDAGFFIKRFDKALTTLAEVVDLAEYFDLVSKHSIYPTRWSSSYPRSWDHLLTLHAAPRQPNDIYDWQEDLESDELLAYVPWWAPKCVIGHLYIPFQCKYVVLPEPVVAEIKKICGGVISSDTWKSDDCLAEIEPFRLSPSGDPGTVFHRLPIWLILLPSSQNVVPCLFASVCCDVDDIQIDQSVNDKTYFTYMNASSPRFVNGIGKHIDDDLLYFSSDDNDEEPLYVCHSNSGITVIGSGVDADIGTFKADSYIGSWMMSDELPRWLEAYPVQRFLKLEAVSDEGSTLVLSARPFTKDTAFSGHMRESDEDKAIFRPAYSDKVQHYTKLRSNTIAAFLLRNLLSEEDANVFESLKNDAIAKFNASRQVIDGEFRKFEEAFDMRYGE